MHRRVWGIGCQPTHLDAHKMKALNPLRVESWLVGVVVAQR